MLNVEEYQPTYVHALPPIERKIVFDSSCDGKRRAKGSGVSYSLRGHQRSFCLPSPSALKPHRDTQSGDLDTWPAHASATPGSTGAAVHVTKDKHLVVINAKSGVAKCHLAPKPKFLEQLERHLETELASLGATEVRASEPRLQAYREVFEYLIEDFKTYKPLLSAIKNEYEMVLAQQRDEIRQLQPLQQMLVAVAEESEQKLMSIREHDKQEVKDLKLENRRLHERIDDLHSEQLSLEEQVMKLSEELQTTYVVYRDECDARKLLISDINELRFQQEEAMMSKHTADTSLEQTKDDPVTLRIALRKLREDEAEATRKLNEMKANYGDVIPRRDYEQLKTQYQTLEEKLEILKDDYLKLKAEHDALLDMHKQVVQQRDDFYVESETLKRSGTPRPKWSRCSEFVSGGPGRWRSLSDGKTSDELVEVLLNEIRGIGSSDEPEYFEGLGFGSEIPKFLRYEGKVKNRRFNVRDCNVLVHDIWKERQLQNAEQTAESVSMAEFVHRYLQQRFSLPKMAAEWAYNLRDACQKYSNYLNIRFFWAVVCGEGDEQVYENHITSAAHLLSNLVKMDQARGGHGTLSQEDFGAVIDDFYPTKSDDDIARLVKAATTEQAITDDSPLRYSLLFVEDDDYKPRPFLDELKKQCFQDAVKYVKEIHSELNNDRFVTVGELKQAIMSTDPETDSVHLDAMVRWAFGVSEDESLDGASTQPLAKVLTRLQFGNVRRTGVKP